MVITLVMANEGVRGMAVVIAVWGVVCVVSSIWNNTLITI